MPYSAITRPRACGLALSCSIVLPVIMKHIAA